MTMLGHPTGRLLLARDSYAVDLDAVIDAAAKAGTMIEINANPHRLDLDAVHCRRARQKGVKIVINPDAHSTAGLADLDFGISVARRAWLTADDVFNTARLRLRDRARRLQSSDARPSTPEDASRSRADRLASCVQASRVALAGRPRVSYNDH